MRARTARTGDPGESRPGPETAGDAFARRRRNPRVARGRLNEAAAETPALAACRLASRLAARFYEVTLADIAAPTRRSRRATRARHVAMYLAHVAFGLPLAAVGAGFRRDRTTAAYACRKVEDGRDDPAFDAALAGLERSAAILHKLKHTDAS